MARKSQGQLDYEADIKKTPYYQDGGKRPAWKDLRPFAQEAWNRPRFEDRPKRRNPSKKARAFVSRKIKRLRREGYPEKQAVAVGLAEARRKGYKVPKRANPAKRHPLSPSTSHCLICAIDVDRRDIGYFDGERVQPNAGKAMLYGSSLVAKKQAARLKHIKGVTYVIAPAHWTRTRILDEATGVRKNPTSRRGNAAESAEMTAAARRLEAFTGHKARTVTRVARPSTQVGFALGPISDITYIAKRDGETAQYRHEFKPKSRPSLVASSDGTTLEIVGGRFRVTARGIVDY